MFCVLVLSYLYLFYYILYYGVTFASLFLGLRRFLNTQTPQNSSKTLLFEGSKLQVQVIIMFWLVKTGQNI